ncbi:hypothetical protein SPHINGO391_400052 [Sphingomonas aurantiaca]|uniref:Uncharacterized protein n=1 Tax=Sphingomonas aurantiaca TaxID=185949 RepID=A0A5E7Z2M8_9SPHN|nr:hypothetical protein SPHINGO391_400052 [Sphingomonas aurantiaca]
MSDQADETVAGQRYTPADTIAVAEGCASV